MNVNYTCVMDKITQTDCSFYVHSEASTLVAIRSERHIVNNSPFNRKQNCRLFIRDRDGGNYEDDKMFSFFFFWYMNITN